MDEYYYVNIQNGVITIHNVTNTNFSQIPNKNNLVINAIIDQVINILKPYFKCKDLWADTKPIRIKKFEMIVPTFFRVKDIPLYRISNYFENKRCAYTVYRNKNDQLVIKNYIMDVKIKTTEANEIYIYHATRYWQLIDIHNDLMDFRKTSACLAKTRNPDRPIDYLFNYFMNE